MNRIFNDKNMYRFAEIIHAMSMAFILFSVVYISFLHTLSLYVFFAKTLFLLVTFLIYSIVLALYLFYIVFPVFGNEK